MFLYLQVAGELGVATRIPLPRMHQSVLDPSTWCWWKVFIVRAQEFAQFEDLFGVMSLTPGWVCKSAEAVHLPKHRTLEHPQHNHWFCLGYFTCSSSSTERTVSNSRVIQCKSWRFLGLVDQGPDHIADGIRDVVYFSLSNQRIAPHDFNSIPEGWVGFSLHLFSGVQKALQCCPETSCGRSSLRRIPLHALSQTAHTAAQHSAIT